MDDGRQRKRHRYRANTMVGLVASVAIVLSQTTYNKADDASRLPFHVTGSGQRRSSPAKTESAQVRTSAAARGSPGCFAGEETSLRAFLWFLPPLRRVADLPYCAPSARDKETCVAGRECPSGS